MNNWNVIQDTQADAYEGDEDVIDRLLSRFAEVNHNTVVLPLKPQRPPDELIRKTSTNLIQFLSISENVKLDPSLIPYTFGIENLRASMIGPREIPNDTNDFYKTTTSTVNMPFTPPYPVDDEEQEGEEEEEEEEMQAEYEDVYLPVLPTPMEMLQYGNHQRILSSILDSTGVSIQEQIDSNELDLHEVTVSSPELPPREPAPSMMPLTPKKKPQLNIGLPTLQPMTPRTSLETMLPKEEKPLPRIPSLGYDGEYMKQEDVVVPQIQLPNLPFSASLLRPTHFKMCGNCSFLSNIWKWCLKFEDWFPNKLISLGELEKCFYSLFKFQIPELSDIFLDAISNDVLLTLMKNGNVISHDEMYVQFVDIPVSGVYPNLRDCYSPMNHIFPTPYRCYSHCCTYERLNYTVSAHLQTSNMILGDDWVSHWKLTKSQLEDINKRVQIQQSHIFDLIKSVRNFINAGKILLEVFGEGFLKNKEFFGGESNLNWDKFYEDAFGTVKMLIDTTRDFLFEPLIQKLNDDGKFIGGISEVLQNWLNEVRTPLLIYAEKRVPVYDLIKTEAALKYSKFTEWITRTNLMVSRDHNSDRLFSVTFLIFFTTLKVTILAILQKTDESDPEFRSLSKVLKNIDILLQESNKTQADAERKIYVSSLKNKIVIKFKDNPDFNLDLDNKEREVYKIGSLTRKRDILHRVLNDTIVVLILLDNYLLLAEETSEGKYKVTETPIHLSYLFVESKKFDEPSTPLVSISPRRTAAVSTDPESHSFRIRHFLKNLSYTFETDRLEEKTEWITELMRLKSVTNHKNFKFEPFKLAVVGDSLLGIEQTDVQLYRQVLPQNDNIMAAYLNLDLDLPRIESISKILCFTRFKYLNVKYILLGTTNGLFVSIVGRPRSWKKILDLKNVSQVKVVEEFSLVFILNDKSFAYYFLDSFMKNDRIVGEKISKRDVSFFKIGKQNGVTMVFFMKLKQSFSYFKVLVPILGKSTGMVESFREYKKFYVPGECSDITILNSTIVIHSKKNFEVMSLSILSPQPIPDLGKGNLSASISPQVPGLETLKKTLNQFGLKPLGIHRLINDREFLIVYNKLAIFINKSGALSKDRLVKFSIKAHRSFFDKNLLVLSNDEFIEVWYINDTENVNYQLVQVIAAQDMRMITDDEGKGLFSMVHPEFPERQLLLALQPKY